jgi:hypothetical protein
MFNELEISALLDIFFWGSLVLLIEKHCPKALP